MSAKHGMLIIKLVDANQRRLPMKLITKIIPILLLLSFSAAGCGNKKPAEETQKKVSYEELRWMRKAEKSWKTVRRLW